MSIPSKAVVFDFNRTVFDLDADALMSGAAELVATLRQNGVTLFLVAKGDEERRKRIEQMRHDDHLVPQREVRFRRAGQR